jgi:hypothetical protein
LAIDLCPLQYQKPHRKTAVANVEKNEPFPPWLAGIALGRKASLVLSL